MDREGRHLIISHPRTIPELFTGCIAATLQPHYVQLDHQTHQNTSYSEIQRRILDHAYQMKITINNVINDTITIHTRINARSQPRDGAASDEQPQCK